MKADGIAASPHWIFFDVGNTLVDESEAHERRNMQLSNALATKGISISRQDVDQAMMRAAMEFAPRLIRRALEMLIGRGAECEELLNEIRYDKKYEHPYPRTHELLNHLSLRFKIGVIANQSRGTLERLTSYGLAKHVSVCLSSTEEGLSKPDPAIFDLALARARCAPSNAVMVGDRIDNDISPAKQAGWNTVRVLQGYARFQQPRYAHELADHTVNSIDGVRSCVCA